MPVSRNHVSSDENYIPADYFFEEMPEYRPIARLSNNIAKSMRMMADIQALRASLPGLDCGACGAPTCRAYAEDVVRGRANLGECPILQNRQKEAEE